MPSAAGNACLPSKLYSKEFTADCQAKRMYRAGCDRRLRTEEECVRTIASGQPKTAAQVPGRPHGRPIPGTNLAFHPGSAPNDELSSSLSRTVPGVVLLLYSLSPRLQYSGPLTGSRAAAPARPNRSSPRLTSAGGFGKRKLRSTRFFEAIQVFFRISMQGVAGAHVGY